jgi:KDO2-lipid IV(A) lauroyltransferase
MREWFEYSAAWVALKTLGWMPRPLARATGVGLVRIAFWFRPPLRRAAIFNLRLAFPDWTDAQRRRTIRGLVRHIGWMAGEFSQFPEYTRENIERIVVLDGFENFAAAQQRGKGVLFLTGHMSAWELAPFAHALYGFPLHFLVRPIDNRRVDALVNRYRCLSGNQPIDKNQSARAILTVLRGGGTVGILADANTSLEDGVFIDFFGIPACSTTGIARIALRTDAAVVPGFLHWDANLRKYRLRFEPAVELVRTGDEETDVRESTALFLRVIEDYARAHPDQWLWVHKRWKTRPPGEKPIYPF